jgi:glucokinase
VSDLRLIADVGGTNARFALVGGDGVIEPVVLPVSDHATFLDAMADFMGQRDGGASVASCAIAAAGPREGGVIDMTNTPWLIDAAAVSAVLDAPVRLFNDLEAVACALPHLGADDLVSVRAGLRRDAAPMVAINVGTGFGAAVAIPTGNGWHPLATEPGHLHLPGSEDGEVEDVLSGPGYARRRAADPDAKATFSALLGRMVRETVLATGSWGGVRFCGGVLNAWDDTIDIVAFMQACDRPGRMRERLATVPLDRIVHPFPGLMGLSRVDVA